MCRRWCLAESDSKDSDTTLTEVVAEVIVPKGSSTPDFSGVGVTIGEKDRMTSCLLLGRITVAT